MQTLYQKASTREQVADFGTRIVAFCIDALLLMLVIGIIEYHTVSINEQAWLFKSERFLHFLLGWLYFAGAESSARQATVGKRLLQLRVNSLEGERISFRCATLRYFLKPLSIFMFLFRFLSGSHLTYKLLFHDKVARTHVIISEE